MELNKTTGACADCAMPDYCQKFSCIKDAHKADTSGGASNEPNNLEEEE